MRIETININDCYSVVKPWGNEIWLQPGDETYPYVLKEILLASNHQTSLQVHQYKSETIRIIAGTGQFLYWDGKFNCESYLNGEYSTDVIDYIKQTLTVVKLKPGYVFHTPPGTVHRMVAYTDLNYIEASTTHLDDVIRLEDSSNRPHGRIESEHGK